MIVFILLLEDVFVLSDTLLHGVLDFGDKRIKYYQIKF
jgi:hypothetical protein